MQAQSVARIETAVDRVAAALLAIASGYAAFVWLAASSRGPLLVGEALAVGVLAYFISARLLSSVRPRTRKLPVPIFDVREVEPLHASEPLLLKTSDVWQQPAEEPLLLDDILAEIGPDSRVVRLFDPAAMPTAGELKSRIDRHLDGQASAAQSSDAAQALHDALAELRRSIR